MMSVIEYAKDVSKDVNEVIEMCIELGFNATEETVLTEEQVIDLDNVFQKQDTDKEEEQEQEATNDYQEEYEEEIEEQISASKKPKKAKIEIEEEPNDINLKRKEMYKSKEKLVSNISASDENIVIYKDKMTVSEFANNVSKPVADIVKKLLSLGIVANINTNISFEEAEILALEYEKVLKRAETQDYSNFEKYEICDDKSSLCSRPAVVTIMGHVDHGKTSVLDTIRKSSIVSREYGGITQHIGAYQIIHNDKKITFIDTPGHAAFTEMRARGASVTDVVIIVVAADDGVKPQTKEAIDHAKAAKVPIIVAINKIDKPSADIEKTTREMAENGISPDTWGGDTIFVPISAQTGEGIDKLLDSIILVAEMLELKANPNRYGLGTVIESRLDKNVGTIVTLLVQNGTLRLGDAIVVGEYYGKIRSLKNDLGNQVVEAGPSTPVEVTGLSGVPKAGEKFMAFESEKQAHEVAEKRSLNKKTTTSIDKCTSIEDLFNKINSGLKEVNIVLKADVKGSEEAVKNALEKVSVDGVKINIIRSDVGAITENDVILANASNAIIIGFNVKEDNKVIELAKDYCVDIRLHNIIYKVVEEIEDAMKGCLDPEYEEKILGKAEVRKIYTFSKTGVIAGSMVLEGIIKNNAQARVIRNEEVIATSKIGSLQKEKDQVKEVKKGFECGITVENFQDIKEKDIIEAFEIVEKKR